MPKDDTNQREYSKWYPVEWAPGPPDKRLSKLTEDQKNDRTRELCKRLGIPFSIESDS